MKKKRRKSSRRLGSLESDVGGFVGAGVGLGVGTAVVAGTGHGAAVLPAFSTMGSMMKPVGTAMMGGHALRMTKRLMPKKKKRRY